MKCLALLLLGSLLVCSEPLRVRLVTGGHAHDPEFYTVFAGDPRFQVTVEPHPRGYQGGIGRMDVLVLYDMIKAADAKTREWLRTWVESGKGLVVLHHAICSFEDWDWWADEVIGARYLSSPGRGLPSSTYYHDLTLDMEVIKKHAITDGLSDFSILDETYKGMWYAPKLDVLVRTAHPKGDGPVVWIGPSKTARVAVIQGGHDRHAHLNPNWQKLVRNAIVWAGTK